MGFDTKATPSCIQDYLVGLSYPILSFSLIVMSHNDIWKTFVSKFFLIHKKIDKQIVYKKKLYQIIRLTKKVGNGSKNKSGIFH